MFKNQTRDMGRQCKKCGNAEWNKIKEFHDKSKVLYYGMQGTPIYLKKYRCGICGEEWSEDEDLGDSSEPSA